MRIRFLFYTIIWLSYLWFMKNFSPLGIDWLPWHESRIFNFVEFLNINPYWQSYGFSIWNDCADCSLIFLAGEEPIYLSKHSLPFSHFIFLNSWFGKAALISYGPLIDKTVIFFTAIACAELFILSVKNIFHPPLLFISSISFSFFALNPWTYKMILSGWTEIYFLMFFLFALLAIIKKQNNLGLLFFFMSGLYNFQWSFLIAGFFISMIFFSFFRKEQYLPFFSFVNGEKNFYNVYKIILSLLFPVLIFITLRFFAGLGSSEVSGSDLLYRIGISGSDMHNGGLLGSLQFLLGNRVSHCLDGLNIATLSADLNTKILIFNCALSLVGMFGISLIAIGGFFYLTKKTSASHILLPLLFAFISTILILQQSSSVHLMGYSYIFSVFFSFGLATIFSSLFTSPRTDVLKIVFLLPVFAGIIILFIHISMMTGSNG